MITEIIDNPKQKATTKSASRQFYQPSIIEMYLQYAYKTTARYCERTSSIGGYGSIPFMLPTYR